MSGGLLRTRPCGWQWRAWGGGGGLAPERTLGYCTCAQEAIGTKHIKKMACQWPERPQVQSFETKFSCH